ncbi:MAG: N-acetylmuramoyl-L-alanine amidase [Bacillota bacterium]
MPGDIAGRFLRLRDVSASRGSGEHTRAGRCRGVAGRGRRLLPGVVWWLPRGTKLLWAAGVAAAGLCWLVAAAWVLGGTPSLGGVLLNRVVVIDPGHGGPDPGAVGPRGELEKDVVLEISRHLARYLTAAGVRALLTRDRDEDLSGLPPEVPDVKAIDLRRRAEIARGARADLFLCIHANATPSPHWRGAQTFYRPNHPDSARLARCIQRELVRVTRRTDRVALPGPKQYVLDNVTMPAVTVEVGFMSNPDEARLLTDPDYQKLVAWAIFLGTARYFAEGERP